MRSEPESQATGYSILYDCLFLWMFEPVVRYSPRDPAGAVINIFDP